MSLLDQMRSVAEDAVRRMVRPDVIGRVMTIGPPPTIRIDGDEIDVDYDLIDPSLTLVEGDRVLLHRARGRLVVAHKVTSA